MKRIRTLRFAASAAIGLGLVTGCQTMAPPAETPEAGNVRLSQAQIADVQAAFGRSMEKHGDIDRAIHTYSATVANDPKRLDATLRLANLHARKGDFGRAHELYARVLEADPGNVEAHCSLGYALYLQEDWDRAEAMLQKAVVLDSENKRAHNNLGLVLGRRGKAAQALWEFQQAGCNETDARLNLAYVLTASGDFAGARAQYQSILVVDPKSDVAKKGLERLELLTGKATPPAGGKSQVQGDGLSFLLPSGKMEPTMPMPREVAVASMETALNTEADTPE